MAFPERFLDELTERNDIVDVVSQYVRLTKKSGANLFGLCPFHSEKTPSFSVAPDKQIYHCFGCGKGGGVINFIMEIENLSFPDAVAFLARRANMPLPEEAQSEDTSRRARLLELNRDAARFFHDMLKSPQGAPAQDYVRRRAISPAMVTRFGLGFAPDSWESLANAMRRKGYSDQEMFEAGLVKHGKSGGVYDAFRNRSVIGFSGRILGDGEPKYLNSPETPVFSKSHNLFGLNLAKKSKNGYIILVEGNIDVVSLHQAGFDGAVASLGTSLTPEQARLISRYTNEVVLCYDSDEAGKKAASRGIGILEKLDLKVRVLQVPGAKDPDEFIKKNGADAFRNLIDATWKRKTRPRPTRGAWTISRARLRFWRRCRARSSARYTPRAWRKRRAYRARRCCRRPNGCAAAALPTRKSGKRATPPAPRRRRSPRSAPSGTTIRARRAPRKA